jgi:hypothetical protein
MRPRKTKRACRLGNAPNFLPHGAAQRSTGHTFCADSKNAVENFQFLLAMVAEFRAKRFVRWRVLGRILRRSEAS